MFTLNVVAGIVMFSLWLYDGHWAYLAATLVCAIVCGLSL